MTATSFVRMTLLAGALALGAPVYAADASMHDVYLAAEAGKFTEAQAMMDQVLRDHPNSGKAHFVEAELLAKQGKMAAAAAELKTAEKLAPGLPFAKAGAVEKLRTLIASGHTAPAAAPRSSAIQSQPAPAPAAANYGNNASSSSGTPWGLLIVLGLVVAGFIVFASRFMARRAAQNQPVYNGAGNMNAWGNGGAAAYPQPGYGPGNGPGYGPGYGPQGGMAPAQGGGLGSSIVGGLATGAAVGAGIVAGQALMHHFTDGNRNQNSDSGSSGNQPRNDIVYDDPAQSNRLAADDMGGTDFGVSDSGSWDDSSSSGGGGSDDW